MMKDIEFWIMVSIMACVVSAPVIYFMGGKCVETKEFNVGNSTLGASGTYCARRE